MRAGVNGEASIHSSGQMESHNKDPSEEDLVMALAKIHLSPDSPSPSPDTPQPMPDSSQAPDLSQKLFPYLQQSQQVNSFFYITVVLESILFILI